jgi:tetratricopeptide (TPR) repeat protein
VQSIIGAVGGDHVEIPLGLGYLHAHRGEIPQAIAHLERAFDMCARERDHWRGWAAAARLVTLALETRDFESASRWCERLQPVAAKMKGGSEEAKSAVLAAVLRFAVDGNEDGLREQLEQLRIVDSKSDLAWALAYVAELELERGDAAGARRDAEEALAAAEAVGRASDAALARAILGLPVPRKQWDDLSERARRRVLARRKEKRNAQHGRRTDVR